VTAERENPKPPPKITSHSTGVIKIRLFGFATLSKTSYKKNFPDLAKIVPNFSSCIDNVQRHTYKWKIDFYLLKAFGTKNSRHK